MLNLLDRLNLPATVGITIIAALFLMQLIGEFLTFKGRVVPEFLKICTHFKNKKKEHEKQLQFINDTKALLDNINAHYSSDNIEKRNDWMKWVNSQAKTYDSSILAIQTQLNEVTKALKDNTRMAEEVFIQNCRDRIINFATKVENADTLVSREEFNRIFKVYNEYEEFLEEHDRTNGEIDVNMQVIRESYEDHVHKHTFLEDMRGYIK